MSAPSSLLQFYLKCYGSDIDAWPNDARAWINQAQADSAERDGFAAAIAEEKRFETFLRTRPFVAASPDLAMRIINAPRDRISTSQASSSIIPEYLIPAYLASYFRPTVLATVLALGFALGFNAFHTPINEGAAYTQSYSDDEGNIL